jgi:hypothetical protein
MICASESAVFIDEPIYEEMKRNSRISASISPPRKKNTSREVHVRRRKRQTWRREWQTQSRRRRHVSELDRREERFQSSGRHLDHRRRTLEASAPKNLLSREKLSPVLGSTKSKIRRKASPSLSRCWNSAGLAIAPRSIAKSRRWRMPLAIKSKLCVSSGIRLRPSAASATSITPSCLL